MAATPAPPMSAVSTAWRARLHDRLGRLLPQRASVLIPLLVVGVGLGLMVLDPLPVNLADRRDFETILATTADTVVLSRSRRDSDGRLLGRSPLLAGRGDETYLRRNAVPVHAFSETDRLMARSQEFGAEPQAVSAQGCWRDWRRSEITAHDGLIRADHPLVLAILGRTQSASSLRRLLRNPLRRRSTINASI